MTENSKSIAKLVNELQSAKQRITELERKLDSQSVGEGSGATLKDGETRKILSELKAQNDFIAQIADTSPVGITRVNRDGEVTFANRRAEEIFGLSKSSIELRTLVFN